MIDKALKSLKEKLIENKKLTLIILLGLIGILLISFSEFKSQLNEKEIESVTQDIDSTTEDYSKKLEERLTELISSIENAGQVKVMITLKSSDENVYAVNENIKSDDKSNNYQSNFVIIDKKSEKEGVLLKILEPQVLGVAVVCTGGDNPYVKEQITNAVTTVLGIGSNKVSVSKMK